MSPLLFLSALRARLGVFCCALGVTVAAAVLVTVLMPDSYRATASLVVDTRQEQSLSNALDVLASPRERTAYIQTQVDVITSPKVARRAVEDLGLAEKSELEAEYEQLDDTSGGSIEDWLADMLIAGLQVETTQSSVIDVSYQGGEPRETAAIANAFAHAYMDTMLELRVEPTREAATWFDDQLKTLRADLKQAQAEVTEFQQKHGIVSADERLDDQYSRLEELSSQLLEAQQQAIEYEIDARTAGRIVEEDRSLEGLPQIQSNEHIQQLDTQLLEGEAQLDALATKLGRNHPEYERQLAENETKRTKLRAEARKIVASAENRALQSHERVGELEKAVEAQREQLLELKSERDELSVLMRNVDSAQNAYDTAMQRSVVSQVESRASQTNVAMLSQAVVPRSSYRPNPMLNIGLAIVVGTILGGGLVLLAELADRRVRSGADLSQEAGVPLLGELDNWTPAKRQLLPPPGDSGASGGRNKSFRT